MQGSFSDGSSKMWLGSCTEFIYQEKRIHIPVFYEFLNVQKMGTICTQVILQALFIANIQKDVFEYPGFRIFIHGYQKPALQHVLQQAGGFQTY